MIWVVHPGVRIRILMFYLTRIHVSKRYRIPDPDPQHCLGEELDQDPHKSEKTAPDQH
jgi:hypothetical protein